MLILHHLEHFQWIQNTFLPLLIPRLILQKLWMATSFNQGPSVALEAEKVDLQSGKDDTDLLTSMVRTQTDTSHMLLCPCPTLPKPLSFAFSPPSRSAWPPHLVWTLLSCEWEQRVTGIVSNHCYEDN